jgi:hypothetical protein
VDAVGVALGAVEVAVGSAGCVATPGEDC